MSETNKSIDVLAVELSGLKNEVVELKNRFDSFSNHFLRNDLYELRHLELQTRVAKLENYRWVGSTLGFVIGGVLVYLINFVLTHHF